ncbi:MAG: 2Fe-2S iron-sulfur cluster binding domain-containing protein, partial [Thermoleophilia bacterium]|nr:2Fe-2S iron-sulfur cluster binding domain-containing protein [Thermoleophilia bacterium]
MEHTCEEPAPATAQIQVTFQPSGRRGPALPGQTLLEVARALGVELEAVCGGKGTCGKCRVQVEPAAVGESDAVGESAAAGLSPLEPAELRVLSAEAVAAGSRLACQARVKGNVRVYVPEESRRLAQVVRKEVSALQVAVNPAVKAYPVVMQPPSLADAVADMERLLAALAEQHGVEEVDLDFAVAKKLSQVARDSSWRMTAYVWQGRRIVDVRPTSPARLVGLALDVGTTTVAAYLTDLESGEVLATESAMNPQVAYGEDVIARLIYATQNPDGRETL